MNVNFLKILIFVTLISCSLFSCKQESKTAAVSTPTANINAEESDSDIVTQSSNAITSAKKNGKCSTTINKCSAGTFSDLSDSTTKALWTCNGINGGTTEQCSMDLPVNGVCSTTLNSCTTGTFVDQVDTATLNKWLCRGASGGSSNNCSTLKSTAGACGTSLNKCSAGTFSDQEDTSLIYKWACMGSGGGANIYCVMNRPIDGVCSPTTKDQCSKGTFIDTVDTDTLYKWDCNGLYNGKKNSCTKVKPVAGVCSTTKDQCTKGTFVDASDDDTYYNWTCNGANGGANVSCRSNKPANGQCGSSVNSCLKGVLVDTADSSSQYLWNCAGIAGGTSSSCSLTKPTSQSIPYPPYSLRTAPTGVQYTSLLDKTYSAGNYDVYFPTNYATAPSQSIPVFIWLNNTFWAYGDRSAGRSFAIRLAERGFIVYNIDVTMPPALNVNTYPSVTSPSVPYTAGHLAFKNLAELTASTIANFNGDPTRVSIGGMEAGMQTMLMAAANSSLIYNCLVGSSGPTDLKAMYDDTQFPVSKWLVANIFGSDSSSLSGLSPINNINSLKARRLYFTHQNKNNLYLVSHTSRFVDAAKSRFGDNVEATYFNDSLQAGVPATGPTIAQLNTLVNLPMFDSMVNFIANKCY